MISRPEWLGERHSIRFQDQSVVDRYHLRPTYPPETFVLLNTLIVDKPRAILDVGCGSGSIARCLLEYAERIDAVDISLPMLERARTLAGGASPRLRWLHGHAEDVALQPPYALITAGESLHWMDWGVLLPRFARLLTPHGVLAIAGVQEQDLPWREDYQRIVGKFSSNPNYQPIDLIGELEKYQLFQKQGEHVTLPVPFSQTVENYIAAQHARSALSLDIMTPEQAVQFDEEMRSMLLSYVQEGFVTTQIAGHIVWGKPLVPER